jgi:hypothetical protein
VEKIEGQDRGPANPAEQWVHQGEGSRHAVRSGQFVLLVQPLKFICSKILYKSRPSDEYQSCRSNYQQYFLQRLYRVFLPRFEII